MFRFSRAMRVLLLVLLCLMLGSQVALAQSPTPTPSPLPGLPPIQLPGTNELNKVYAIVQMVTDLVQGKVTPNPDQIFQQSRKSATDLLNQPGAGIFFLDFADPNLGINQFAASV